MVQLRITALAWALFLTAPASVQAQGQGQSGQPAGPQRGLETITVTARKVEQDLQTTAEAVTVFTGADLDDQAITEVKNIGRLSPNVRIENVPGTGVTATMTIRGISQADLLITVDPSVGIYTDGVYNARLVGGNFNFFDVERVEVLKGPQGTLYGKNTPAGAVNVWSRRPQPELGGYLRGTLGNFRRRDLEGAVSFPLAGEQLSGRIAFLSRDDDGYIEDHAAAGLTSGVDGGVGDQNGRGVRMSALWNPSDELEIFALGYRYEERRHAGFPHQVSAVGFPITSPVVSVSPANQVLWAAFNAAADEDDMYNNFRGRQDLETTGGSLIATYDLGAGELKYTAGHRRYQFLNATDTDGSPLSLFDVGRPENPQDEKSRQSSHELTLNGSVLDENLRYTTGLYYFDERSSNEATQFFDSAFGGLGFTNFGVVVSRIESYAAYAQGYYSLTDRLDLALGIRHTEERREVLTDTLGCSAAFGGCALVGVPLTPAAGAPRVRRPDFSDRWDRTTWLAGLEFRATDETFLYGKVSTGYRSGGFNGRAGSVLALGIPFDEETVTSYEVGAKRDWLDDRLRTNLALFFLKYKDIQGGRIVFTTGGIATLIENTGSADVSGGELEVWAEPVSGLRTGGSLGWNWFRYTSGLLSGGFQDLDGDPLNGAESKTSRSRAFNSPAFTYALWVDYHFPPFDFGELGVRLDFQYQSRNILSPTSGLTQPTDVSPQFGILGGRISLDIPRINSEIALIGTNLLDRRYFTAGVDFAATAGFGYFTRYWAPRRRVALELTYRFGAEAD
jgi:iron complex outermembrane receptor protein